jgi:hypothetical protein
VARLTLLGILAILACAGCGGDDASEACDDAAFVAQGPALAVAQASLANAIAGAAPEQALAADLRRGADALAEALSGPRPCDPELVELRETELASLARMDEAVGAFERGEDNPREELSRAAADLTAVEERLVARKG